MGRKQKLVVFIVMGSKFTADDDCSHEMKKCLLLGRKATTKLDGVLKSRDLCRQRSIYSELWFLISHIWMCKMDQEEG